MFVDVPVLDLRKLSISGDDIVVRDARGRGPRPSLVPTSCEMGIGERAARGREGGATRGSTARGETARFEVHGDFSVRQRFAVSHEQGRRFVESSRDDNPIHIDGDIVPGAMTAARLVLLPEILLEGFVSERMRVKFRAVARYDLPTLHHFRVTRRSVRGSAGHGSFGGGLSECGLSECGESRFDIHLEATQRGQVVAEGQISGACRSLSPAETLGAAITGHPDAPEAVAVETFLRSLQIDPLGYFSYCGWTYPRAFLASLPSGEMVRQLSGEGGLLNSLNLDFVPDALPTLTQGTAPVVEVESGKKRQGSAFRKVMTRVFQDMSVCCQGFATVFQASEREASLA